MTRRCECCGQPFEPRPQVPNHQTFCSSPDCQRARKLRWQQDKLRTGPDAEVAVVKQIYRWFVEDAPFESEIAERLNAKGIQIDLGRDWTRATVREVFSNEKYIVNNVYNRRSFKLKKVRVVNQPEMWIKKEGAFEGIVPPDLFYTAQGNLRARAYRFSNEELIEKLRRQFQQDG